MKIKRLKNSNEGVAGVVVGLLFVGFIITAIAFVQSNYVPQWMEEKEAIHMDTVNMQFAQIKHSTDTLSALSKKNSIISNPITLGSKEMPFLFSQRSYGNLNINPNSCKITITSSPAVKELSVNLGSIKYSADNNYFIDQEYILEMGGILLIQDTGKLVTTPPSIYTTGEREITFDITKFVNLEGKSHVGGIGTFPIKTKYKNTDSKLILDVIEIKIESDYTNAWKAFLNEFLDNVEAIKNDKIDYSFTDILDSNGETIGFSINFSTGGASPTTKYLPIINTNIAEIQVEIASK